MSIPFGKMMDEMNDDGDMLEANSEEQNMTQVPQLSLIDKSEIKVEHTTGVYLLEVGKLNDMKNAKVIKHNDMELHREDPITDVFKVNIWFAPGNLRVVAVGKIFGQTVVHDSTKWCYLDEN